MRTYILDSVAKKLSLKVKGKEKLSVLTFGSQPRKEIVTPLVDLRLKLVEGSFFTITANVVSVITGCVQRSPVDSKKLTPLVKHLNLADPIPLQKVNVAIEMLIGKDIYLKLMSVEKIEVYDDLFLINSKLGWILSGSYRSIGNKNCSSSTFLSTNVLLCPTKSLSLMEADECAVEKFNMKKFWDLDTIGIKETVKDQGDEIALRKFNETIGSRTSIIATR